MEPETSWLCDAQQIETILTEIAKEHLPYAVSVIVANERRRIAGNVDIMIKGCQGKSKEELIQSITGRSLTEADRINESLNSDSVTEQLAEVFDELERSIDDGSGSWKSNIPGKAIFKTFCSKASIPSGRLKTLYIQQAEEMERSPFEELVEVFEHFSEHEA